MVMPKRAGTTKSKRTARAAGRATKSGAFATGAGSRARAATTPAGTWREVLGRNGSFARVSAWSPLERVEIVRAGVPAAVLPALAERMAVPRAKLYAMISVPRATADRKVSRGQPLSREEGERALALARLVGQVEGMVGQAGQPERFDAARWLAAWLDQPNPALGGRRPATLLDTADGRALVSDLLEQMQSGAYA